MNSTRRSWFAQMLGLSAVVPAELPSVLQETAGPTNPLRLQDYRPRSMLRTAVTEIDQPRFSVIDFHSHLSSIDRTASPLKSSNNATREEVVELMDRLGLQRMVNLTGGYGTALEETLNYWQDARPDRFTVFTQPWFSELGRPDYPRFQAQQLEQARNLGAGGLKVTKALGLYVRERGTLVKIDDSRFDPMWETAGSLSMPVAIHISDPEAFFHVTDRLNERYEELQAHPNWSFQGKDYPSSRELHEARNRVIERHPETRFVLLHMGMSEDLSTVGEWLQKYSNLSVEFGARIAELGRQPKTSQRFFDRFQDRILFGTDATPGGFEVPQQLFVEDLYRIYYRFLETEDEYFDYAPAEKPSQGRWKIYGLGLPDQILRKIYQENAARLLGLG